MKGSSLGQEEMKLLTESSHTFPHWKDQELEKLSNMLLAQDLFTGVFSIDLWLCHAEDRAPYIFRFHVNFTCISILVRMLLSRDPTYDCCFFYFHLFFCQNTYHYIMALGFRYNRSFLHLNFMFSNNTWQEFQL